LSSGKWKRLSFERDASRAFESGTFRLSPGFPCFMFSASPCLPTAKTACCGRGSGKGIRNNGHLSDSGVYRELRQKSLPGADASVSYKFQPTARCDIRSFRMFCQGCKAGYRDGFHRRAECDVEHAIGYPFHPGRCEWLADWSGSVGARKQHLRSCSVSGCGRNAQVDFRSPGV
jgi:hypothetical protein